MKFENIDGWGVISSLKVPDGGGVRLEYFCEEIKRWVYCCVFATLDEESLFKASDLQSWTRGTVYEGTVMKTDMTSDKIFWNYFVSFAGLPKNKECKIRITIFESCGANPSVKEMTVNIDSCKTIFINNWEEWQGGEINVFNRSLESRCQRDLVDTDKAVPNGWVVDEYREGVKFLSIRGKEKAEPIHYQPQLSGAYDLYVCLKENTCDFMLELPGIGHPEKIWFDERVIPAHKFWKEIYVGQYTFTYDDKIKIIQTAPTIYNPLRQFGDLAYLKLVPSGKKKKEENKHLKCGEIIFYSEPYSIAYYHELQNEKMVESLVNEYASLGAEKIICQMGRGGSFVIFPSKTVKPARTGAMMGDDKQKSTGVSEMMANINIMKTLPEYCKKKNIKFIANIGLNASYPGSPLESDFSAEHQEYHHPKFHEYMDFTFPAVREYTVNTLLELAEYEIDGLSIDHCRYPYAQTTETIVELHRLLVKRLGRKRREALEINIRFPVDNPDYYQALKTLLSENLVESIIPSNFASLYPEMNISEYTELAKKHGKKIYGCLDFFTYIHTHEGAVPRPAEFHTAANRYMEQGADGLFFYQSEMVLRNVFQRRFVKSLKSK